MTTLTIELSETTNQQLQQQGISEELLTVIINHLIQLYLSQPQTWKTLGELVGLISQPINHPNSVTLQALAEAKARQNLSHFNRPEDLFADLVISQSASQRVSFWLNAD